MKVHGYATISTKGDFKLYSFNEDEVYLEEEKEHFPEELQEETKIVKCTVEVDNGKN